MAVRRPPARHPATVLIPEARNPQGEASKDARQRRYLRRPWQARCPLYAVSFDWNRDRPSTVSPSQFSFRCYCH